MTRLSASLALIALLAMPACASTAPPQSAEPIALDGTALKLEGERYLEVRVGRTIAAPPGEIWRVLTTAKAYTQWNSTIVRLDGQIALGEEIELVAKIDPERSFELTVSTFAPNEKLVWEDGGAMFRGVRTFTLTPTADGQTQVTMREVFTGAMMGMIAGKLPDFRPSFEQFLKDLENKVVRN